MPVLGFGILVREVISLGLRMSFYAVVHSPLAGGATCIRGMVPCVLQFNTLPPPCILSHKPRPPPPAPRPRLFSSHTLGKSPARFLCVACALLVCCFCCPAVVVLSCSAVLFSCFFFSGVFVFGMIWTDQKWSDQRLSFPLTFYVATHLLGPFLLNPVLTRGYY